MRHLDRGMSGADVARWERFLVRQGHLATTGAGVFDEATSTATRGFQEAACLNANGRADAATLAAALLRGLLDPVLDEAAPPKAEPGRRTDWTVLVPLMVAVVGGLSAALISILNGRNEAAKTLAAEREKLRSSILLQAIRTDDPARSVANLRFFARLRFIDLDEQQLREMEDSPATAPVLPVEAPRGLSAAERDELLGRPSFRPMDAATGDIELDAAWVEAHISGIDVPQLGAVPRPGGEPSTRVRFHAAAAPALIAAFAEIERRGLLGDVRTFDGAFRARTLRGSITQLSAHALGIAFDINSATNPHGQPPVPVGVDGSVVRLVPIFERHGFFWGGRGSRLEGNHFEFADREKLRVR